MANDKREVQKQAFLERAVLAIIGGAVSSMPPDIAVSSSFALAERLTERMFPPVLDGQTNLVKQDETPKEVSLA